MYKLQCLRDKFNKLHYKMLKILYIINNQIGIKSQKNILKNFLRAEKVTIRLQIGNKTVTAKGTKGCKSRKYAKKLVFKPKKFIIFGLKLRLDFFDKMLYNF